MAILRTASEYGWRVAVIVAIVLPPVVLHWGAGRPEAGLTAPPFGWPRLLIVHCVAAGPVAWLTAKSLARRAEAPARVWLFLAVVVSMLAPALAIGLSEVLNSMGAPLIVRAVCRSGFAWVCLIPGMAAAASGMAGSGADTPMVARWAAVILALVPPGVYADRLIAARAGQLSGEMASGRFVKARLLVLGLQEVGADPHSLIPVRLADLDASIQRLSDRVKHPLPPHTAPGRQIDRAFHLIQLDRLDEAAELLAPWAESEPAAAGLLLAGVRRDQKRWDEAIRTYESVLLRLPRDALEARTIAYQGLAEALIAGGRPDEAETVLSQALQEMPQQAAHWHWQLGNYYFRGGRPLLARQHLGKARDLSPQTMGPRVTPILDSIRRSTPGCLFR